MSTRRKIFTTGAVTALLLSTSAAFAADSSYERGLEAAMAYRYSEALMHFQQAAEQGDRSAQRNLGLMLLYGGLLYGNEVRKDSAAAKRWLQAAAENGCEVSAFTLKVMAQNGR